MGDVRFQSSWNVHRGEERHLIVDSKFDHAGDFAIQVFADGDTHTTWINVEQAQDLIEHLSAAIERVETPLFEVDEVIWTTERLEQLPVGSFVITHESSQPAVNERRADGFYLPGDTFTFMARELVLPVRVLHVGAGE